jgi:hypothetical protein
MQERGRGLHRAVPAFELAISQAISHSKDLSEKNLTVRMAALFVGSA